MIEAKISTPATRQIGRVVIFFGPKAGAGQTTLLVNSGILASTHFGHKVCILDLDLQHGDLPIHLGLYPSKTLSQLVETPFPWSTEKVGQYLTRHNESRVDVLFAPAKPEHAETIQPSQVSEAIIRLQESHDLILVDAYGLNRHSFSALDLAQSIVIISTSSLSRIKDVKLTLDQLKALNYRTEHIHLIFNQRDENLGGLSIGDVEEGLKHQTSMHIPYDAQLITSINTGRPISLLGDDFSTTRPCPKTTDKQPTSQSQSREAEPSLLNSLINLARLVLGPPGNADNVFSSRAKA